MLPAMKSIFARFWLASLLIAAAIPAFGAETNHNFVRWEKEIATLTQAEATNPPPKGALLFIGSSTIRKWQTLAKDLPDQPVINHGFGGSAIVDSTHFADKLIFPYAPRMIFLRAGGNDLWDGESPEAVFADFKEFVAVVQARLPETDIIFISLSPTPSRWKQAGKEKTLNTLVHDFIQGRPHLRYIETYDMALGADGKPRPELFVADQLHFNAAGYKLLTERVRNFLATTNSAH